MSRTNDRAELQSQLLHVLGYYQPGGAAVVFEHAGEDAEFVAVHERAHRDLVRNTVYGFVLTVLISAPDKSGCTAEEAKAIWRPLMARAWDAFEGHAVWAELLTVAARRGAGQALASLQRKPESYQRAFLRILHPSLLDGSGYSLPMIMSCAVAEYAVDRTAILQALRAADLRELALALVASEATPDSDLDTARSLLAALANHPSRPNFEEPEWNGLIEHAAETPETDWALLFRKAVCAVKQAMAGLDPLLVANGVTPECFSIGGMQETSKRLFPDAVANEDPAEALRDDVRFGRAQGDRIDLQPEEVAINDLEDVLSSIASDPSCHLVIRHEDHCLLLEHWEEFRSMVLPDQSRAALEAMLAAGEVRSGPWGPVGVLHLIEVQFDDALRPGNRRHLLCWPGGPELKVLVGLVQRLFGERWAYLTAPMRTKVGDWVHSLAWDVKDRTFVVLKEHGTMSMRRAANEAGPFDFHWRFPLETHAHVVCFGKSGDHTYFAIGPGPEELVAKRATNALGIEPDTPTHHTPQLLRMMAAVSVAYKLVPSSPPR